MSLSTANICPAILTSLSDNLINNPANVQIHGGMLAALTSSTNLAAGQTIRQANDNGTGQSKEIRVVYKERKLASSAATVKDCVADGQMNYIEETVPINNYRGVSFTLSEAQLRTFCDSYVELTQLTGSVQPNQIVERANGIGAAQGALSVVREIFVDFQLSANALIQAMNDDLITAALGGVGDWYGGIANPTYTVENTSDGSVKAKGLFEMKQSYMNTGFNGAPIVVGAAGALQRVYMNDSRYFGQGANGINFATVRDNTGIADFYFDTNIAGNMTNEDSAIVFAPGSLLYLPYLQYVGNYGRIGTMERFTMPLPGLPSVRGDVRVLPDSCDENYAIWLECFFDLFSAPVAMFQAGDSNEGVNGVFKAQFVAA